MATRARFLAFNVWFASLVGLVPTLLTAPAAAEVKYSVVDRATVRVLALGGVEMTTLEPDTRGRRLRLAVAKGGHGSGVKLTSDGIVLTAAHVVEGSRFVVVKEPGTDKAYPARVIYASKKQDIAFLLIPGVHQDYLPLPQTPVALSVRQSVFAVGYPLDPTRATPQSNRGVVAGMLPDGDLQLGISINPGNSGGPVIDEQDRLLGIVVRGADPTKGAQGLGEAVPVDRILPTFQSGVVGTAALEGARASLSRVSPGDWAAADLVAHIAEQTAQIGILAASQKLEDLDLSGFREPARVAYAEHKGSADLLAMLAGHYWNEAAIRYALEGGDWKKSAQYAKALALRALQLDAEVGTNSPFVLEVAGRRTGLVAPAPAASASATRKEAPPTAAGFKLGASAADTQKACTLEGHQWTQTPKGYHCSGPAEALSLAVEVDLAFCDGRLCRVDLLHVPSRELSAPWKDRFREIKSHYERRFGPGQKDKVVVPEHCKKELLPCLTRGEVVAIYSWQWPEREVQLSMGRIEGKPVIRISHRPRQAQ
jgi:hypothetical protein